MALPLEVLADLRLAVDGEPIDIRGDGDRIVVDLPSLRAGRRLLASGPFGTGNRRKRLRQAQEALDLAGLTVEVRLQNEVVARAGAVARPGTLARALGLGPVEVRPAETMRRAARQRPWLTIGIGLALAAFLAWWLLRDRSDPS
jgi:hypothetical protein